MSLKGSGGDSLASLMFRFPEKRSQQACQADQQNELASIPFDWQL
jgi:hypothetical protein